MFKMRQRKTWIAVLAILLLFAACKGETPTAPPPGGGTPGTPPPTGVNVAITVSNTDPLVDSTVLVTVSVTNGGTPVPNGTAVELSTTHGLFTETATSSLIRTTTNGIATATLTASSAGLARITAVVNNVSRTADVTFRARPVTTPPPNTAPTISSITPSVGSPAGGQIIRITGTNFRVPVRVLFDLGKPLPVEASIVSVSDNLIEVITPGVDLTTTQQLAADITVITRAGTTEEQSVSAPDGFTFRNEVLTPSITTATPNSGPIGGGTIVQIIGTGFQAPVQVFFGSAEARVIEVKFAVITVEAPDGRSTSPDGSATVTGFVPITVVNIDSATRATQNDSYRYITNMVITAAGPGAGFFTGGTRVTIDGTGFVSPVTVVVRTPGLDIPLTPISVSGSQVVALTSPVTIRACADLTGPIVVTNINNGDSAIGPGFTFIVPQPTIVDVNPSTVTAGGSTIITVANAIPGVTRIKFGALTVFPTSQTFDPDTGVGTFTVTVPTDFAFPTEACTVGSQTGTRDLPIRVDVVYLNVQSTCTDTAEGALVVNPCNPLPCPCDTPPAPPAAEVTLVNPPAPACAEPAPNSASNVDSTTAPITFRNDGGQPLTIVRGAVTGANAAEFTVTPSGFTVDPGQSATFTVTFTPAAAGVRTASVSFTTNDADEGLINVCLSGTGTP